MPELPVKPDFKYAEMLPMSREGIKGANNKYLTRSLFLETAGDNLTEVRWVLGPEEQWVPELQRWLPSAHMCYMLSVDEYDALRKICGSVAQWECIKDIKSPKVFADLLENWQMEQAYLQRRNLKAALYAGACAGGSGYVGAVKEVLKMIDGPVRGKGGKKEKAIVGDSGGTDPGIKGDAERIAQLFPKKTA